MGVWLLNPCQCHSSGKVPSWGSGAAAEAPAHWKLQLCAQSTYANSAQPGERSWAAVSPAQCQCWTFPKQNLLIWMERNNRFFIYFYDNTSTCPGPFTALYSTAAVVAWKVQSATPRRVSSGASPNTSSEQATTERKQYIFFLYGIACGFCFDTGSTRINTEKGNWLHILRNVIFRRRITLNTLQRCSLPTTASCKNRHRLDPSPEFYPRISISWNHHHWCLGLFFKKKKIKLYSSDPQLCWR